MLADSLFGLVTAAFPLPHLPPMEPDFIPAGLPSGSSIKLAIGYFSILVNFGGGGCWTFNRRNMGCQQTILIDKSRGEAHFGSQWENSF
jgi:hypothetical protein